MIGRQLSHYRVVEKLGAGGMGEVYRARDERLDRDVALKVLPANAFEDESARRRFRREATALSRLNHPNIATIHDFDHEQGVDFLVMEYVDGTTLRERLERGALSAGDVASLGAEIAAALEEAHEHGVVHRDLKPANIALTRRGQVKVLDFGLARLRGPVDDAVTTESRTHGLVGTLPYMAPETLRGAAPDHRADIYALGVVLYELATGRRPFEQTLSTALADDILHQDPTPPGRLGADLPRWLEHLILRCLEKSPERRYQTAREIRVALQRGAAQAGGPSVLRSVRRRWRVTLGAALLAMTLGGIATLTGLLETRRLSTRVEGKVMLAVLPFENLSPDPEQEYFSAGLTEELIAQLGQLNPERLGVIARTSAALYRSGGKPASEIGRELGAQYLLEGSVRSDGGAVRITAQLVQVADQTQLWAGSYERALTSIFSIQSDVARKVTTSLAIELLPSGEALLDHKPTDDFAAHEAYLKGRYHWSRRTPEDFEQALAHFEHAITLDPAYARAYSGLADTYILLASYSLVPKAEARAKAAEYARQGLALDETLAEAHTSLAAVLTNPHGDLAMAEREFRRAIELNPSYSLAHQWFSALLSRTGRVEEAISEALTARSLDPLNPRSNVDVSRAYYNAHQYQKALDECRRARRLDPDFPATHSMLGLISLELGRYDEAIEEIARGAPSTTPSLWLGHALARAGRRDEARRELAKWEALWNTERAASAPGAIAAIHIGLGDTDGALEWLEKAPEEVADELQFPYFDPLRSEPRFQTLRRRVGQTLGTEERPREAGRQP
jgi:eukaryotic-like serine/threonine-protein kinase